MRSVETLREPSPCLLEADPFVEGAGVCSALRGCQEHETTAACTRFGLHRLDERLTDSATAMIVSDDDRAQLCGRLVVFDREADMETSKTNDASSQFRDDKSVHIARCQTIQAQKNGFTRRCVAELCEEVRQCLCVLWNSVANSQSRCAHDVTLPVRDRLRALDHSPVLTSVPTLSPVVSNVSLSCVPALSCRARLFV